MKINKLPITFITILVITILSILFINKYEKNNIEKYIITYQVFEKPDINNSYKYYIGECELIQTNTKLSYNSLEYIKKFAETNNVGFIGDKCIILNIQKLEQ